MKWLADCLVIFFSSEDWAAAEALGKLATVERNDLSSIRSLVSIGFVWMRYFILGDASSVPSHTKSHLRKLNSGHMRDV